MKWAVTAVAVLLGCAPVVRAADLPPLLSPPTNASPQTAMNDLLANFWVGTPSGGHINYSCGLKGGCMWEGAQAANVLYSWWKITGSADAATRIAAHWRWMKSEHPNAADFTTCGGPSRENYASDDTGWDIAYFLQAYDVTHDQAALSDAKGALECARGRWWDQTFGGGYWYDDHKTGKGAYQTILILDELTYYQFTGDAAYLKLAKDDEAWMVSHLLIGPNQSTVSPAGVGLYFTAYTATGCKGAPGPAGCPYHMNVSNIAQDQTMLVANMAMSVVDSRLFHITNDPAYQARMLSTAAGIRRTETNAANAAHGALNGMNVFTDDQDANVNAFEAAAYLLEVVPHLPPGGGYADGAVFKATAEAIMANDRLPNGFYGGDWQGPVNGVWTNNSNHSEPQHIVITSNAINMVVVSAGVK